MGRTILSRALLACAVLLVSASAVAQTTTQRDLNAVNECATLNVAGMGTGAIEVNGTWVGTITFRVSVTGAQRQDLDVSQADTPATFVNTATANGAWSGSVAGYRMLYACMTAYTSGTASVNLSAAAGGGGSGGGGGGAASTITSLEDGFGENVGDDANDAIRVNVVAGSSAGTQYTEADVDASITGNALLFEGAANALVAAPGTAANGLLVDVSRVTGTVTVGDGAGALNVIVDSGALTATVTDGAGALNVIVDSGAITVSATNLDVQSGGLDLSTAANQVTEIASLANIESNSALLGGTVDGTADAVKTLLVDAAGAALALASDWTIGTAITTAGPGGMAVYSEFDGAALPTIALVDIEGEAVPVAASIKGVQYVMVVNEDGSLERGTATTPTIVGDGAGALNVICDSGCSGSGGASHVDDAAFTPATDDGTVAFGVFDDTTPDSVDEGDGGAIRMSANRNLYVRIRDNAGNERGLNIDAAGALSAVVTATNLDVQSGGGDLALDSTITTIFGADAVFGTAGTADADVLTVQGIASMTPLLATVTNAGTFAVQSVEGAGALLTSSQLLDDIVGVEDVGETAGGGLARMGSVRRDTAASSAGAAGDNATVNTDDLGRLWMRNGDPCSDPARVTHAAISESTAATNEIVALNGSDLIFVCSYKWVTTAANSLSWTRGTGTDCATGTAAIEGAQPYGANGGVTEAGGGAALFSVPAGNALCLVSSAATAHAGRVSYVRTAAP